MKLTANQYESKEIFRIVREWTNLTQEQIGEQNGKKVALGLKISKVGKVNFILRIF